MLSVVPLQIKQHERAIAKASAPKEPIEHADIGGGIPGGCSTAAASTTASFSEQAVAPPLRRRCCRLCEIVAFSAMRVHPGRKLTGGGQTGGTRARAGSRSLRDQRPPIGGFSGTGRAAL